MMGRTAVSIQNQAICDGGVEPTLEVIAPADIRDSVAVPLPDETEDERKHRDDVFFAILDAGGY